MAEDYEDYGDETSTLSPDLRMLASLGQNYTSPEAKAIAKRTYERQSRMWDEATEDEDTELENVRRSAEEAKAAIRAARQNLLNKRHSKAELYFAMSRAFGSPTRTGAFGETIGNVAGSMIEPLRNKRAWEDAREKQVLDYDLQGGTLDRDLAALNLKLLSGRRDANTKLMQESLKILGKEVRPGRTGSQGMSPFGKIAADEGLVPGTIAFTRRVKALYDADMAQRRGAAGLDVDMETPNDLIKNSYDFGVPIATVDPFAGLSTKGRQTAMGNRAKDAEKTLAELAEDEENAKRGIQQADRFVELNKTLATGPLAGWIDPRTWLTEEGQEMRSITAQMARTQRVPGEGQISNFDAQQFIRASMAVTKDKRVNENLARGIKAMKQTQLDFSRFMNDYYAVNKHLVGAKEAWARYVTDNPIYDPAKPGSMKLNKNREKYQDYFRKLSRQKPTTFLEDLGGEDDTEDFYPQGDWHPPMAPTTDTTGPGGGINYDDPIYDGLSREEIEEANTPARAAGGRAYANGGEVDPAVGDEDTDPDILTLENAARALLQGGTANFSDEMLARARPGEYDDNIQDERAALEALQLRYPGTELGLEVAGGLVPGIAGGYALHKGLGKMRGRRGKVAGAARAAERLLPRNVYGKMAIAGGTSGAISGVGAAQDSEVVDDLLAGGAMGTLFGPLGGLAAKYGRAGLGRVWDRVTGNPARAADEKLLSAVARDEMDMADIAKRLKDDASIRVPSTVADVGGKNVQALTEAAASKAGEGPARMVTAIERRQAGAGERAMDQVNKALAPDEYYGKLEDLRDKLYTQAKPLYDAAYQAHPAVKSKVIGEILSTKDGKRAARRAMRMMEMEGVPVGPVDATGMVRAPSLQYLDYVKRGLDGLVSTEERAGSTDLGRALRNMRNRLKDELDTVSPEYKAAREQFAGDLELVDAIKLGREQFARMAPKELAEVVKGMSWAEKDVLRSGVAEQLFTQVMGSQGNVNAAKKIVGTPAVREKLKVLFDKPKEYQTFIKAMDREIELFERGRRTISRAEAARAREATDELASTPLRQAADFGLDLGSAAVTLPGSTASYGPANAAARVMAWVRRHSPSMTQKTAGDVSEMLSISDPKQADELAKRLIKEGQRLERRQGANARAGVAGSAATAVQLNPDPEGYVDEEQ